MKLEKVISRSLLMIPQPNANNSGPPKLGHTLENAISEKPEQSSSSCDEDEEHNKADPKLAEKKSDSDFASTSSKSQSV